MHPYDLHQRIAGGLRRFERGAINMYDGAVLWLDGQHEFLRAGDGVQIRLRSGDRDCRFYMSRRVFRAMVDAAEDFLDDLVGEDDAKVLYIGRG